MWKLVVVLLALVATSQAYIIIETFSDTSCNETSLIARFISNDPYICNIRKRGLLAINACDSNSTLPGVTFGYDFSGCSSDASITIDSDLSFPDGWQSVKFVEDANCNFTVGQPHYSSAIGAPQTLQNTLIAVYSSTLSQLLASNTSLSCGTDGTTTFASCSEYMMQQFCLNYALENNVCTADSMNMTYALQTTCVALPVGAPISEPMTNEPITAPVATPFKTPIKAPSSKTSTSSILGGSAAILLLVSLIRMIH